jgi:hypothetical protein
MELSMMIGEDTIPNNFRNNADELLGEIGILFSQREEPGSFEIDTILGGASWERLKSLVNEADGKYKASKS